MAVISTFSCFATKPRAQHVGITVLECDGFDAWHKKQSDAVKLRVKQAGFKAEAGQILPLYAKDGVLSDVIAVTHAPCALYDSAVIVDYLKKIVGADALENLSFSFNKPQKDDLEFLHLGWALGAYQFTRYKAAKAVPALVWDDRCDKPRIKALVQAITMLRDLVNTPANDMGPADLEAAAKALAQKHKAKIDVIKGKAVEKGFPLVHAVGMGAAIGREPRLIDITWGKSKDPALTIVGKGVCFDTGGLDMKPSAYMKLMKKDMGGAAHALALAHIIMALKIPVQLRVIIPAVENSVSAAAFRPGDTFTSRSGKVVENTDTDAEGRLILADALTYASEGKPDLIVDFATLTGSARAALGMDIPAGFTNDAKLENTMRTASQKAEDLIWPMPLHQDYKSLLESNVGDLHNHVGVPGDLIYSALFLQQFVLNDCRWMHVDCYAWELSGRPGRPKGGKDTGLRGMLAVIEDLYSR